jgi:hypothetical protein
VSGREERQPEDGRSNGEDVRLEGSGVAGSVVVLPFVLEVEVTVEDQGAQVDVVVDAVVASDTATEVVQVSQMGVQGYEQKVTDDKEHKHTPQRQGVCASKPAEVPGSCALRESHGVLSRM